MDRPSHVTQEKEDRIFSLISSQIEKQCNVTMNLDAIYSDNGGPGDMLVKMYTANDPPEIVIRSWYDINALGFNQHVPSPLKLNDAISRYGLNLTKIPEYCWEMSKIGNDIVSIPSVDAVFYELVANKKVIDKYHWTLPTTLVGFNDLLKKVKDNGITPIKNFPISVKAWFGIPFNTYMQCSYMYYDARNELQSCYQMPEYYDYIRTMNQWIHAGYIDSTPPESDELNCNENWLFNTTYSLKIGETDGVISVPNMAFEKNAPITNKPLSPIYCYESYHNPDGVVVLMNWLIDNEDNYMLMTQGEKDVDFEVTGDKTYKVIHDPWAWRDCFLMYGAFSWTFSNCPNLDAVNSAISEHERYSASEGFFSLPFVSKRYAVTGSQLAIAWENEREYESMMEQASMQYIGGAITIDEYSLKAKENYPLIATYKQLLTGYLEKSYNPEKDMLIPR